ncbi:hypothetical protein EUGRSUZ_F03330 [Eucalyptus grandis]|uniref:Uncharacterized protein n=2 Tax=Eucalyptus grandis TaxID=71139 RepID=A0ACC3KLZ3_EUCGR|nr:hypothetical protein EUGRSUZ_F03330 [Eucalyptus grandis]
MCRYFCMRLPCPCGYLCPFKGGKNKKCELPWNFVGPLVPGLAVALLGLRQILNTSRSNFLKGSSNFKIMTLHSELIHVFSFSICAIFAQVVDFPFICLAFEVHSIEQTTVFLNLAIFSGFTLCAEINQKTGTLLEVSGCSCSFCFWSRTYPCFISIPMIMLGLEGRYHWQLQLVALVSFLSALAATCFPTSFLASLVLAIFVTFQGCRFFLCVPECVPKVWTALSAHTSGELVHGAIICGSGNADCRVRALANLQFSWILAGILFLTGILCMKLASIYTERGQHTEYKRLLGKVLPNRYLANFIFSLQNPR